jgi:Fe-S-cluster containining protein
VYFTWPDRVLSYDCRGCAACCKGLGIGIDVAGGQLVQLIARRPQLAAFVRRRGDAVTAFNPRDRCWFLADDGLCRIEVEDGRAAKPASCRLFPFNRVFRLGSYTVVDYNSVICPLRVDVGGGASVSHADVLAEIAAIADPAIVGTPLPFAAGAAETDGRALVDRERAIAAACFTTAATGDVDAAWRAQISDDRRDAVGAGVDAGFAAITGTPWQPPPGATLGAALWLTPSLRFNELYGPRPYPSRDAAVALVPALWRAWLGFARLGAELAGRDLGLQELTTLWSEQVGLATIAARWHEPPVIRPGPIELPSNDPGGRVRAIGQACVDNRKSRRPLGDVIGPLIAPLDPVDRVLALKLAEPVLRAAFAR